MKKKKFVKKGIEKRKKTLESRLQKPKKGKRKENEKIGQRGRKPEVQKENKEGIPGKKILGENTEEWQHWTKKGKTGRGQKKKYRSWGEKKTWCEGSKPTQGRGCQPKNFVKRSSNSPRNENRASRAVRGKKKS